MTKLNGNELANILPRLRAYDWNRATRELDEVIVVPNHFVDENDVLHVSGEDGHGFVDYYGEFTGGYPYICTALEEWAAQNGGHWEWDHPGSISFYRD